ncbi:MAG: nickel pincer cofactor biosynthesis protein LarC [Desulfobacteraceae bacterium]|nr:MAG: nickel pincer cofactor biosynthesis protein LarC [Desulfobacteraceae bacterium]
MILYFDIHTGISGDMILGTLVDLGVPLDFLNDTMALVPLSGFELRCETVERNHLTASSVTVDVHDTISSRHYSDIKDLINGSRLSEKVKIQSLAAFGKIARAESGIHGHDVETVHFHEVGGIDALVDIIGAFAGMEYLNVSKVHASVVPLGSGSIECSHGVIPVPAPATLSILKGVPVKGTDIQTEIVTPTGAAILTTLTSSFGPLPELILDRIGYGAGKRELGGGRPNLLRGVLGHPIPPTDDKTVPLSDEVMMVQANIDDMNPEIFEFLMEQLFDSGALDVGFSPLQMKKNRPGTMVQVLCPLSSHKNICDQILRQTTTAGVRFFPVKRYILKREAVDAHTRFGTIRVKRIDHPDLGSRLVPEYDVCKDIALNHNLPLRQVYDQINADLQKA